MVNSPNRYVIRCSTNPLVPLRTYPKNELIDMLKGGVSQTYICGVTHTYVHGVSHTIF